MEQLVLVALFLAAALLDLLVRWLRGKTKAPRSDDDFVIFEEDPETQAEREWLEAHSEERTREPVIVRRPVSPPIAPPPPTSPPPPPPLPSARRSPPVLPRPRPRRWLAGPRSARQAIVLMTILGPCRGLE